MRTGGCHCGSIRYEAEGQPDFPHLCSCPHCQRLAGGPVMAWVNLPLDGFRWTGGGGEPTWFYTFPDSKRGFCGVCGSNVCAVDDDSDAVCVTMMSLDDHRDLVPESQSFSEDAVPWLPPLDADN